MIGFAAPMLNQLGSSLKHLTVGMDAIVHLHVLEQHWSPSYGVNMKPLGGARLTFMLGRVGSRSIAMLICRYEDGRSLQERDIPCFPL